MFKEYKNKNKSEKRVICYINGYPEDYGEYKEENLYCGYCTHSDVISNKPYCGLHEKWLKDIKACNKLDLFPCYKIELRRRKNEDNRNPKNNR